MPFRKFFSLFLTMPALIGALCAAPALAQEEGTVPGAIPDPSTYQGSMEQQRQSDAQDQQFRQQQQQQPAYQGQSRSGGYGASRSSRYAASDACYRRIAVSREFAPLAGRLAVGYVNPQAIQLFDVPSKPGAAEKLLLQRWLGARRHCKAIWDAEDLPQAQRLAEAKWGYLALVRLTSQLMAGQVTYGQFNYRRAMNSVAWTNFVNAAR